MVIPPYRFPSVKDVPTSFVLDIVNRRRLQFRHCLETIFGLYSSNKKQNNRK